jgi:hypothetical protein
MIYLLTICIGQLCTPHYVTEVHVDGFGNAWYVENAHRFDVRTTAVSLTGSNGTLTELADRIFTSNFEAL